MACLPRRQNDPGSPAGQTVHAFLERLRDQLELEHKWRDRVLLLTDPGRFKDEADGSEVPWSVVKQLRQEEDARGGALSIIDLAAAADRLSAFQLERLAMEEFPVMMPVAHWQELLALIHRSPLLGARLLSTAGVPFTELPPELATELTQRLDLEPASGATASLRVTESALSNAGPSRTADLKAASLRPFTCRIRIEAVAPDQKVLAQREFAYRGRNTEE
jgi:hypothetical protein